MRRGLREPATGTERSRFFNAEEQGRTPSTFKGGNGALDEKLARILASGCDPNEIGTNRLERLCCFFCLQLAAPMHFASVWK